MPCSSRRQSFTESRYFMYICRYCFLRFPLSSFSFTIWIPTGKQTELSVFAPPEKWNMPSGACLRHVLFQIILQHIRKHHLYFSFDLIVRASSFRCSSHNHTNRFREFIGRYWSVVFHFSCHRIF